MTSADSTKSTSIILEALICAGFQTVTFDSLTPLQLLSSLMDAPRSHAQQALDCYNELVKKSSPEDLLKAFSAPHDPSYKAIRDAYSKWAAAAAEFRSNYGEGMVVGVVWGGIGQAELTVEDDASARTWKYGGAADFTCASGVASVSVGATYDASGSSDRSKVTVSVTRSTSGTCAKDYTDAWFNDLNGKAFDAVASIKPLDIPVPSVTATVPTVPDFVSPKADPKDEENIKGVTKDDLQSAAKVAAYDRAKALYDKRKKSGDPEFHETLDEFLKRAEKQPDPTPVRKLKQKLRANALSTLSLLPGDALHSAAPASALTSAL